MISTSVGPARDGVRYFGYANALATEALTDVSRRERDHPGYPLFLAGVFGVGRSVGIDSPRGRVRLAQIATAAIGAIGVGFAFLFALRTWAFGVAVTGCLAYVLLPRPLWQTSDVLSDPLYATLALGAAWLFVLAAEREGWSRARGFAVCGLVASAAYWVRFDAIVCLAALVASLVILSPRIEGTGRGVVGRLRDVGALLGGFVAGFVPFVVVCGRISPKPVSRILSLEGAAATPEGGLVTLAGFGASRFTDAAEASLDVVSAFGAEHQYLHAIGGALGVAMVLLRGARTPGRLFAALFGGGVLLATLVVRSRSGYTSARYFLALAPLLTCLSVALLAELSSRTIFKRSRPWAKLAFVIALTAAASVPSLFGRRLHQNYRAVVAAAEWVAERRSSTDTLGVRYAFAALLAGVENSRVPSLAPSAGKPGRHFAIVRERDRAQFSDAERAAFEGVEAKVVAHFRDSAGEAENHVTVYEFVARELPPEDGGDH